jgi:hypothetical protein
VSRFLPADFACDLRNTSLRALNVNKAKVITEEYLRSHESKISWSSIRTGPLTDFCLARGVLINMKERSILLYDSGNKRFSTTTIETASKAIVAVLKLGDKSKNRAFRIQDFVLTQNKLLQVGKEILPDVEWKIVPASTSALAEKAKAAYEEDPDSRTGSMMQKAVTVFGDGHPSDFGVSDNAELGIEMMDDDKLRKLLKSFA